MLPAIGKDENDVAARKQKEQDTLASFYKHESRLTELTHFVWPFEGYNNPYMQKWDDFGRGLVSSPMYFFPESITVRLPNLTILDLQDISASTIVFGGIPPNEHDSFADIPPCISRLTALTELRFDSVPDGNGNKIRFLPRELCAVGTLKRLRLSNNHLITLPNEIGNLSNLESLWLNNNMLVSLPPQLGDIVSLKQLILSDNLLTTLPSSLSALKMNLKSFNVMGNRLTYPPPDVVQRGMKEIFTYLFENPIVEGSTIGADMSVYLTNPQFADLKLRSHDGVAVNVHKALLHAWSHGAAECRWRSEKGDKTCIDVDATGAVLRCFAQWIYTESCRPVSVSEVSALLRWFSIPHMLEAGVLKAEEKKSLPEQLVSLFKNPLYSGKMKEATDAEIVLADAGEEVEVLIRYLYSGQAEDCVGDENILECAIVAHKFGDGLLRSLETLIQQGLDTDNAVSIIHMCEMYSMIRLLNIAAYWASQNWILVRDSKDWRDVTEAKRTEIRLAGERMEKERNSRVYVPAATPANVAPLARATYSSEDFVMQPKPAVTKAQPQSQQQQNGCSVQ